MPDGPTRTPPPRFLDALDSAAQIHDDEATDGWILSIGGAEQSHVDLVDPRRVFYEYLRRIANVLDLMAPRGDPLTVVHLGGGAMTLPRYLAVTRPDSEQTVVELARELPDYVLDHLPWPPTASKPRVIIGDAREMLPRVKAASTALAEAVVLDVFAGAEAPGHLTERSFYEDVREILAPDGLLIVNVGDDPGLRFFASQVHEISQSPGSDARPAFNDIWCLTERSMLSGTQPGNLVLVACNGTIPTGWRTALETAGPHPGVVLDRWELETWVQRLS